MKYTVAEPWYARLARKWLNWTNRRGLRQSRFAVWMFHYGEH